MEAWRRQLDAPVSAFPIAHAGPAHIATLKTFDPPPAALEGRKFTGAERRAKRLLFPTDDGELVLLVHLMTAGRLKYLVAGEKAPAKPAFALEFAGGAKLVLTENAKKKRAGVWLLTPRPPRPSSRTSARRRTRSTRNSSATSSTRTPAACTRSFATSASSRESGARGRTRSSTPRSSRRTRSRETSTTRRSSGSPRQSMMSSSAASPCARPAPPTKRRTASTASSASPATSAARRSPRWTSRSTRSSTAPRARPGVGFSRTVACRGYSVRVHAWPPSPKS